MTESNPIVSYHLENGIATIKLDDGQNNLISPTMIRQVNHALDQAEKDKAIVILTGREEVFSAGFDLRILKTGVMNTFNMLIGGFELAERLLSFPSPIIIACNGHAIAMGVFLLLSGDYRIGVTERSKIVANEVAIGLTMPFSAVEICRQRLVPAHFERAVLLSEEYDSQTALQAGFLDEITDRCELLKTAMNKAVSLKDLDLEAHTASKLRSRHDTLKKVKNAIREDRVDFVKKGVKRVLKIA